MSNSPPKSAIELAMEKLAKQDAEAGVESVSLTDMQRDAMAEARRDYEAKKAEYRILHESKLRRAFDPDTRAEIEANFRRDLAQVASDRDRKIDGILKGSSRGGNGAEASSAD